MTQMSGALLAHSILFSTAVTAVFALLGLAVGWQRRRTTYAMSFAVLGGFCAFGLMGLVKLGESFGL